VIGKRSLREGLLPRRRAGEGSSNAVCEICDRVRLLQAIPAVRSTLFRASDLRSIRGQVPIAPKITASNRTQRQVPRESHPCRRAVQGLEALLVLWSLGPGSAHSDAYSAHPWRCEGIALMRRGGSTEGLAGQGRRPSFSAVLERTLMLRPRSDAHRLKPHQDAPAKSGRLCYCSTKRTSWNGPRISNSEHSQVEVQEEFVRYGPQIHRRQLAHALVGQPGFDHVPCEHITL
jgi:hypothetical protein